MFVTSSHDNKCTNIKSPQKKIETYEKQLNINIYKSQKKNHDKNPTDFSLIKIKCDKPRDTEEL